MQKFTKGDVVLLHGIPHYLQERKNRGYCHIKRGMKGVVVGYASTGKVAVQFFDKIWSDSHDTDEDGWDIAIKSSFDNGCHGKGELGHCAYVVEDHVRFYCSVFAEPEESDMTLLLLS